MAKRFSGELSTAVFGEKSFIASPLTIEEIRSNCTSVIHGEYDTKFRALQNLATLLSSGDLRQIEAMSENEIVPCLVKSLSEDGKHRMKAYATWALANIAGGLSKHTEVVVANGAVPVLVQLLSSGTYIIQMKAAWALGNIACDSIEKRDIVVENGSTYGSVEGNQQTRLDDY